MLKIKGDDFEMAQNDDGPFFDLSKQVVINAGKENERKEMKVIAYGLPFESCIKAIVSFRINKEDKEVSLSEYIKIYAEAVNEIQKLLK